VDAYGMTKVEAIAMFRANASDLAAMFERLGPPPDPVAPEDEEPPAVEGVMEPEEEAPPTHGDAVDGVYEEETTDDVWEAAFPPEEPVDEAPPATEPEAAPASPPVAPAVAQPEPYTSEAEADTTDLPSALIPPMFQTRPESCYGIEQRFADLLEQEDFTKLVAAAWKKVTKTERPGTLIPSPGTCNNDVTLLENLTTNLLARSELWWKKVGYKKHGGQ
jgi:hypothetical protein